MPNSGINDEGALPRLQTDQRDPGGESAAGTPIRGPSGFLRPGARAAESGYLIRRVRKSSQSRPEPGGARTSQWNKTSTCNKEKTFPKCNIMAVPSPPSSVSMELIQPKIEHGDNNGHAPPSVPPPSMQQFEHYDEFYGTPPTSSATGTIELHHHQQYHHGYYDNSGGGGYYGYETPPPHHPAHQQVCPNVCNPVNPLNY